MRLARIALGCLVPLDIGMDKKKEYHKGVQNRQYCFVVIVDICSNSFDDANISGYFLTDKINK